MTAAPDLRPSLEAAIAALQAQRAALGDALVDAALAPLLDRLALLAAQPGSVGQAARTEPARRLRQVSVLFLDLVGSTQLIQLLDPEEVQAVVDGALAAFTVIVEQHGGEVLRYAGDNLKAAFGAHETTGTREDDAERAVQCGLALLAEAARRGDDVRRAHGHDGFNARVGIHTGGVVRGGGVENDKSLSGLTVNIAARLEQAAPAGTLRISVDTYRQVQGLFDVKAQASLQVKGLQEPLQTYLVLGQRERRLRGLHRGTEGAASALVGRDAELAALRQLAARVFTHGGLGAASVLGEAGLGKSRLLADSLAELQAELRADGGWAAHGAARGAALWSASSRPQGLNQPCGLLRDLLFWHHGVQDSDTQAQAQAKFAAALAPIFGAAADEQTALLGQLIGLDYSASPHIAGILREGRQLRARGFHAWAQYLRLQASQQPLVLVLDDLQWADDESLDAIEHMVAVGSTWPVLLLCGARPELLQRRPDWGNTWPGHLHLVLAPLAEPARQALAGAMLQRLAQPAPQLQALLSAQAAGNPYYMEALLQMLLDTGVIQSPAGNSGPWQVQDSQLQALQVPTTLVAVLQATLDALLPAERLSLQQASVVGAQFWNAALAAIDPAAPAYLPALSQRELALLQAHSSFDDTQEYAFRHHLLHQVTYGTVLKPDKRAGHHQAALWLQARSLGREAEVAVQIAEHFDRAGIADLAMHHWLLAAEDASRRQSDSAAMAHTDRALALDDGSDLQRQVRLHRVRANVAERSGDAAATHAETTILNGLADQLDDDVLRLQVAKHLGWRCVLDARFADAVTLGEQHLTQAAARSPIDAGRLHNVMFMALSNLGREDEALAHAQRGLACAQAAGDFNTEGAIHNNLGVNHERVHRILEAQACFQRALAAYNAAGSRYGAITVQVNLAELELNLGRYAQARDMQLHTLQDCQDIGHRAMEAMARANLGRTLRELGDARAALDSALLGLQQAQGSGDRYAQGVARTYAHLAALSLDLLPDALDHARAARTIWREYGDQAAEWTHWSATASTLHALGEQTAALAEAEALLADVAARGGWDGSIEAPFYLYRMLAPLGDPRAPALLATARHNLGARADLYSALVPRADFLRATIERRAIADVAVHY